MVGAHVVGFSVLDDRVPGVCDLDLVCELSSYPDPTVLTRHHCADLDVINLRPPPP